VFRQMEKVLIQMSKQTKMTEIDDDENPPSGNLIPVTRIIPIAEEPWARIETLRKFRNEFRNDKIQNWHCRVIKEAYGNTRLWFIRFFIICSDVVTPRSGKMIE
jgi:hypothetical protein